ncbi:hypothetical protein C8J27_104100 [Rhodobacter aestuarii]|uniref:Uncharacterized protein n=2 Tax=Rhodobacter aestuarii TaxID=453582 RepID=A0A1N7L0F2_9RHOB|nr:hypothetical protein C8J27_104100 [Rhodobacter aestuarii]SIS67304.1 hypothetical protein SAMN05421580_103154 [Rhodobacter aestuarii]
MTQALASYSASDEAGPKCRLIIESIGGAAPANAAAIAHGLGLSVQEVMAAIYRAPCVLVEGLPETLAGQMAGLLRNLGCEISICGEEEPLPPAAELFDVALHVSDAGRYGEIVKALGTFLGMTESAAAQLMANTPCVVLGRVSPATISALEERLGPGASLIVSNPDTAQYDLFLGETDTAVQARLLADLRRRGVPLLAEQGCLAAGLSRTEADAIWSVHHRISALRIVNAAFERFDLVLTGGAPTDAALAALADLTEVPPEIAPQLFETLPIIIADAQPAEQVGPMLEHFGAAGLDVRAELVTFLNLGIEIIAAPNPADLARLLQDLGFDLPDTGQRRFPMRLPFALPELQARILREALSSAGIHAELFDPAEEVR